MQSCCIVGRVVDVHRLRVFRSVVASGSIQAAADNLGYTPSAVSQQVASLQRETGLTLLTRVGRGVEPTAAGLTLAGRIDPLLAEMGDLDGFIADLRQGRSGAIRISFFASAGSAWMPGVVKELGVRFPDLRIDLELREQFDAAAAARTDVQVVVDSPDLVPPTGYRAHHLLDDPYLAVLPPGHRLAGAEAIELGELADEEWIDNDVVDGWCRKVVVDAALAAGFTPPFRLRTHDYRTAMAFVAEGLGLTIVPRLGIAERPAGLAAVPLTGPTPVRTIHAVTRAATDDQPAIGETLRLLRARASVWR